MDALIEALKWFVPLVISIYSGVYVTWRILKREERKNEIEYWRDVAKDLTSRFEKLRSETLELESQLARYRMMKDYVFETIGYNDPMVHTAQRILSGEQAFKERRQRDDDITVSH